MRQIVTFCQKFSLWLTLLIGLALTVMSGISVLEYRKLFSGKVGSFIEITAIILLALLMGFGASKGYQKMQHTGNKTAMVLFLMIVLVQIGFLALVSHPMTISDAARVQEEALAMVRKQHGQMNLQDAYFQRYTNNHFITVMFYYFFRLLKVCGIEQIWLPTVMLNIVFVDAGIYITYRVAKHMKGQAMANMILICFLLCPTTYVWLTTAYTNTLSFPFVMGILYICLTLRNGEWTAKNIVKCILLGIFMAVGYSLRPTTILPILAVILFAAVRFFQKLPDNRKKQIGKVCIVFVSFGIVYIGCCHLVDRHVDKSQLTGQFPITHWIMMGLNESSYGAYAREDESFTMSFPTKEEKRKATSQEIKHRLQKMGPAGVAKQLFTKMVRVWAMGDDDSLTKSRYATDFPILYEYVMGNKNGNCLLFTQAFRMCIFFFLCLSVIRQILQKNCHEIFLFTLTFLGAVLFFMLWEANRKYNICFMGVYLILAVDGIQALGRIRLPLKQKALGKDRSRQLVTALFMVCVMGTVVINGVLLKQERQKKQNGWKHLYQSRIVGDSISIQDAIDEKPYMVEQTLLQNQYDRTENWNCLTLYFTWNTEEIPQKAKQYFVEVIDQTDYSELYKEKIGLADLNEKGEFVVRLKKQKGQAEKKYLLRLIYIGTGGMQMVPKVNRFPDFDAYPYGKLRVNGKSTKYDLSMGMKRYD